MTGFAPGAADRPVPDGDALLPLTNLPKALPASTHPPAPAGGALPLVAIVGPTAAGKTVFAVELAERLGGEIIGADSRQIYRGMDAGTAKPAATERARVPHHLIDIVEPDEPFGLAQYVDAARATIEQIRARGCLPLLAGGTGQYVRAVVEGWQVPRVPPDVGLRAALEDRARQEGPAGLHAELARLDPESAAAIHPANTRRVIRALEIFQTTGLPPSSLRSRRLAPGPVIMLGLSLPRALLYERIDRRVDAMFEAGLVEEVERLLARGFAASLPSLSAIGYAQTVQHLRGEISLAETAQRIKTATHRLARQQATWFRADDPGITWLTPADLVTAQHLIEQALASGQAG